ncbi:carbohydrate binding domain-containing protein [Kitasatospora sp. NPDC004614]|uniref:carbohydrate binding domain-containing protein n=1 Tax=unclassified Kitasatospora TaxID=2633591 RepID=UPI00367ACCF8
MAFPQTPVPVVVELQIGGTWTDITSDVYVRDGIKISRGRADEGSRPDPAKCSLTINNRSGKYSPRNPLSPYYGLIGRNTPIRVSIPWGATYLQLPGTDGAAASTPHTAALGITGDIDVRVDCTLRDWYLNQVVLVSKSSTAPGQRSWSLLISRTGQLSWAWSTTGTFMTSQFTMDSPIQIPANRRIAVRVTHDVDNGAGGSTVTFWTAAAITGPWTAVGSVTGSSTTSIFNSTSPVWIGDTPALDEGGPATGRIHAVQIHNGIGGVLVANPDFTVQTPGATSFTDAAGRTWTVSAAAELTNRQPRFIGEASEWPQRWDLSNSDVWVPIRAAAIKRRAGQGNSPLDSPLRRSLVASPVTVAYWPCEDGRDATQAANALSGGTPLAASGLSFAADDTLPGSLALPTASASASISAAVPVASTGTWQTDWQMCIDTATGSDQTLMQITSTGTAATWRITLDAGAVRVYIYSASGTLLSSSAVFPEGLVGGGWHSMQLSVNSDSGNIIWSVSWFRLDGTYANSADGIFAGTGGNATAINTTFGPGLAGLRIGHLVIRSGRVVLSQAPARGYSGESAQGRALRLAAETGTPLAMGGAVPADTLMGVQRPATLLDLLDEAAESDGGALGDDIELMALCLRGRASIYNQPPALALDYRTAGHVAPPLEPVDDDQHTRNSITIQRIGGSSALVELAQGPLSVQAPPAGIGRCPGGGSLSLYSDAQAADVAGWQLHLGTQNVQRYPTIRVDLAAGPDLIGQVLALREGDRITITSPPPWLPPEAIDQLALGWDETIGVYDWDIEYNCIPNRPWQVAQLDDTALSRLDTDGSQLAAGATSTAATLSVVTTAGPVWSPNLADSPWDIDVAGERITVAAVGQLLNDNPFFSTDLSGWTAQASTLARSTVVVHTEAGGAASIQITPNGTSVSGGAAGALTAPGTVIPGQTYTVGMWAYSPTGWSDLRPAVDWSDAAGTFLSSGLGSATAVPAGQWTHIQQTLTAPAGASRATPRARHGGTPSASAVWYAWAIRLVPTASVATTSPQQMTVIRAVNGISKALPAGTPVALADPSLTLAL